CSYPDPGGHFHSYQQTSDPDPENPVVSNHNPDPDDLDAQHSGPDDPYTHANPGHNDPCSPVGLVPCSESDYHLYPAYYGQQPQPAQHSYIPY
ncbi:hypothetical protein Tco_0207944, partial [Tanacetum coccineum]